MMTTYRAATIMVTTWIAATFTCLSNTWSIRDYSAHDNLTCKLLNFCCRRRLHTKAKSLCPLVGSKEIMWKGMLLKPLALEPKSSCHCMQLWK